VWEESNPAAGQERCEECGRMMPTRLSLATGAIPRGVLDGMH